MRTLSVALDARSYPIHIGTGLLADPGLILPYLKTKRVAVITNTVVGPLYLAPFVAALRERGLRVTEIVLPDGEAHKDWPTLNLIFDGLLGDRCDRSTTLIALGGRMIGDMVGFAAASYQRGVPFIQVPTTLLSQVDSSVGGKTAINHPLGKNMIGAFYQPQAVLSDTAALKTLPPREYASGLAEIIKHALIFDAVHLAELERDVDRLNARDDDTLARVIAHSCRIKADVVKRDERETLGIRALLNLGHTFGHAIETEMGYGAWMHGEAVATGCVLAAELSQELGHLSPADVARVKALFAAVNLPIALPDCDPHRLLGHMQRDKKNEGGTVTLVLLRQLGEAYLERGVPEQRLLEFLQTRRPVADG